MYANVNSIKSTSSLEPGEIFFHVGLGEGALCISALQRTNTDRQKLLIVPLNLPSRPDLVRVPSLEQRYRGTAVLLADACAEVEASTAGCSKSNVYSDGVDLFLPLRGWGYNSGFLNLKSGLVVQFRESWVGFGSWRICIPEVEGRTLWQSGDEDGKEG